MYNLKIIAQPISPPSQEAWLHFSFQKNDPPTDDDDELSFLKDKTFTALIRKMGIWKSDSIARMPDELSSKISLRALSIAVLLIELGVFHSVRKALTIYNIGSHQGEDLAGLSEIISFLEIINVDSAPIPAEKVVGKFIQSDIRNLNLPSNSANVVYNSFVLDYIEDKDQALKECLRVLRPGGVGVFILHHPDSSIVSGSAGIVSRSKTLLQRIQRIVQRPSEAQPLSFTEWVRENQDISIPDSVADFHSFIKLLQAEIEVYSYLSDLRKSNKLLSEKERIEHLFSKNGFVNIQTGIMLPGGLLMHPMSLSTIRGFEGTVVTVQKEKSGWNRLFG